MALPDFDTLVPLVLLQGIKGVTTVWVWDVEGGLIFGSVDGEVILDGASTAESWEQIESLLSGHPEARPGCREMTLDFDSYLMLARREEGVLVALMAQPEVNRHAVRLGLNIFYRRVRTFGIGQGKRQVTGNGS